MSFCVLKQAQQDIVSNIMSSNDNDDDDDDDDHVDRVVQH